MEKIAALEDAIAKKSLVGIYSVFYTIAHGDPNFSSGKFKEVLRYVESQNLDGFFQEFDGEEFEPEDKWTEDYWALVASSLIDNFCLERIQHLELVGKKLYPEKRAERQTANSRKCTDKRKGLISDERKKRAKFEHNKRVQKDDGGILSKFLGPRG